MTYWSRKSKISLGLGSSSHFSSELSESSSSMISLHRSMHSSQMYTPGPAMSFLTCFCDLPQKEHFSRSLVSPTRATDAPSLGSSNVPDATFRRGSPHPLKPARARRVAPFRSERNAVSGPPGPFEVATDPVGRPADHARMPPAPRRRTASGWCWSARSERRLARGEDLVDEAVVLRGLG